MRLVITRSRKRVLAKRPGVSEVIAILLLIVLAIGAAVVLYAFVTGLIGGLSNGAGSNLYPTTATLVDPTGTSPGTLVITVRNNGNSPVTGIQVALNSGANTGVQDSNALSCMGETPAGNYACGTGGAAACPSAGLNPVTFCNVAASPVDSATPLAVGSEAGASVGVASHGTSVLESGSVFTFTVTVDTGTGSAHTEVVTARAVL